MFDYPTYFVKYLAAFLEWSCYRRCGFVAKQNFFTKSAKVWSQLRKRVPTLYVSDHKQRSYWSSKLPNYASFSPLLHNVSFHKRSHFSNITLCRAKYSMMSIRRACAAWNLHDLLFHLPSGILKTFTDFNNYFVLFVHLSLFE